jgi:hypothetical protein
MTTRRWLTVVNGLLLLAIAIVIGAVQLRDRASTQIEGAVDRYAIALAARDLDACLAELPPDARDQWRDFVASQLGNTYNVDAVSVRSPAVLERVRQHVDGAPYEATLSIDVDRDDPAAAYQATTRVPVAERDGRWYLAAPPLAESYVAVDV